MKWRKARDAEGNPTDHIIESDAGYRIAQYSVAGVMYYRPSKGGQFISHPTVDPQEAREACDQHNARLSHEP